MTFKILNVIQNQKRVEMNLFEKRITDNALIVVCFMD